MPPKKRRLQNVDLQPTTITATSKSEDEEQQQQQQQQVQLQEHEQQTVDTLPNSLTSGKQPRINKQGEGKILPVNYREPLDPNSELYLDADWDIPRFNKFLQDTLNYLVDTNNSTFKDFIKLPSRKFHPIYFHKIENPISIKEIKNRNYEGSTNHHHHNKNRNKSDTDETVNMTRYRDCLLDIELIYKNCLAFNEPESLIVKNSMQAVNYIKYEIIKTKNVSVNYLMNDGIRDILLETLADLENVTEKKVEQTVSKEVMETNCDDSTNLMSPFLELVDKSEFPDYYEIIHKPVSLKFVENNLKSGYYKKLYDFYIDVVTIFQNALVFNAQNTLIYQDAIKLLGYFRVVFYDKLLPQLKRKSEIGELKLEIDKLEYDKYLIHGGTHYKKKKKGASSDAASASSIRSVNTRSINNKTKVTDNPSVSIDDNHIGDDPTLSAQDNDVVNEYAGSATTTLSSSSNSYPIDKNTAANIDPSISKGNNIENNANLDIKNNLNDFDETYDFDENETLFDFKKTASSSATSRVGKFDILDSMSRNSKKMIYNNYKLLEEIKFISINDSFANTSIPKLDQTFVEYIFKGKDFNACSNNYSVNLPVRQMNLSVIIVLNDLFANVTKIPNGTEPGNIHEDGLVRYRTGVKFNRQVKVPIEGSVLQTSNVNSNSSGNKLTPLKYDLLIPEGLNLLEVLCETVNVDGHIGETIKESMNIWINTS
ncbi:uncharacterized protein SCODWIG_03237 [Saccharomycodes ludwigii]|uniref:Bromo domain-containing protein n=1 Tax=Saccharomycodes ludwigii TaxID=36035 RepID=A0A376B9X4_9ASCO|nr:uncharacterized protein SCODWIG_03237 [Saccharomycodes ludwigii]